MTYDIVDALFVPLTQTRAKLGESPVWSDAHDAIWWVDIQGHKVLRTTLAGETQAWTTPEMPGFVQCIGRDVFIGMQSGIFVFDDQAATFHKVAPLYLENQRFNDACTDAQGRIWAGTMDIDNQHANGVLYLFDPAALTLTSKAEGSRTINGLAWDNRNQRLFFSDSHPSIQTVWTVKINQHDTMSPRTVFARFDDLSGRPDGAAIDAKGRYWIAGVGGGAIYCFEPDGTLGTKYNVPFQSPTKPAFVPPDNHAMVLTSFTDNGDDGKLGIYRGDL
ncbi:Sugar lactone lactonase YvrE [Sulfitobacter marinus]|uniref:Sugar lactone lactonase YvrE n=2 Tax=Sulfitobacter marinus TaxID=394264 RepID=A0A1I6QH26_9RHOB|nr:Sugar lactone lactonase YvrE [Sulfitobacter marinus]